jgi:hypothetical protein
MSCRYAHAHIALGNLEAAKRDLDQLIDDPAHEYLMSLTEPVLWKQLVRA